MKPNAVGHFLVALNLIMKVRFVRSFYYESEASCTAFIVKVRLLHGFYWKVRLRTFFFYESEASCINSIMKISLHSYTNETYFHMKSFARSLAFITRLKATRKWPSASLLHCFS